MLSGYKTYIVATVMAIIAILHGAGVDIPGVPVDSDWLMHLLEAFGLGALRAGVETNKTTIS